MSNSFAFGYLYAKLEEINANPNCSFSDIIEYANTFGTKHNISRLSIVFDDEILEEICAIYCHCEDFYYMDNIYWIVGDDDIFFGIVWIDTEKNKIVMLKDNEKEEVLKAFKAEKENRPSRISLPIAIQVEEPVATAIPVAEVVSQPETVRVIRVNANLERKKKNEGGIYLWDRNENVIYNGETKEEIGIVENGSIQFY